MSYGIKFIVIIGILIALVTLVSTLIQLQTNILENFSDRHILPFTSPFHSKFFTTKKHTAQVSVNRDFGARVAAMFAPTENCNISNDARAILLKTNARENDFTVVSEDLLFNAVNGIGFPEKLKNLRLVATLFSGYVTVLCPDDLPFYDFSDIKKGSLKLGRRLRINVGLENSTHHTSCMKIAGYMGLLDSLEFDFETDDIRLVDMWKKCEIDLIYRISEHPISVVRKASDKIHSHLLTLRSLNNGNIYSYTLDEQEFYDAFVTYHKALHDLDQLVPRVYPSLTVIERRALYLPTVSSRYVLVCHDRVPADNVENILVNIISYLKKEVGSKKYYLKDITEATLSYTRTPIDFHPAAAKIYRNMNLISNSNESNHCIFYRHGQCPSTPDRIFNEKVDQSKLENLSANDYADQFVKDFGKTLQQ